MNILSWNVNGLRSLYKNNYWEWIIKHSPDIFCLQETKAHPEQLPSDLLHPAGYSSYFSSSVTRKGYSGVATYTKIVPDKTTVGLEVERFDEQGRVLTHYFNDFVLVNAYVPNGASKTAPLDYKLDFFEEFLLHLNMLKESGHSVIVTGDINVAHEPIDLARPEGNKNNIGFLPEERAWIDEYIAGGFIDVFRYLNPQKEGAYTYWDLRTRARDRNIGWRLDYFFTTADFLPKVQNIQILNDVYGSDHCPIELTIKR